MSEIKNKAELFCKAVEGASSEADPAVQAAQAALFAASDNGEFAPDAEDWKALERATKTLEKKRWFARVRILVDAASTQQLPTPRLRRHYAQALIEQGEFAPAIAILSQNLRGVPEDQEEHSEALGLLGRTFKQIYVNGARESPLDISVRAAFCEALEFYRRGYELNRNSSYSFSFQKTSWLGTNYAGLARRAQELQIDVPEDWQIIARGILQRIQHEFDEDGSLSAWDYASAGELALILNEVKQCREWFERYAGLVTKDGFALNSTLRQLREVWKIRPDSSERGRVVADLMRRAVLIENTAIEITPEGAQSFPDTRAADVKQSEKILGASAQAAPPSATEENFEWDGEGPTPSWIFEYVLKLARNTVRIVDLSGSQVGTGFIVQGSGFGTASTWAAEPVLVTCAHVISCHGGRTAGSPPPLHPRAARAVLIDGTKHDLREVLCEGGRGSQLDVSIVRFISPPPCLSAPQLRLSSSSLAELDRMRLFLVGYPKGRNLCLSYHPENQRLGVDHRAAGNTVRFRYYIENAPGYSGSPVLGVHQGGILVIGIHVEGRVREDGDFGRRQLPEGEAIWFSSVVEALQGCSSP